MKKILLALGVGAIGFFLWKKFSKKKGSATKSFSGGNDFFNASGNIPLKSGGYYSFEPKDPNGWRAGKGYYIDNRIYKINSDKENVIIKGRVNGFYYDYNTTQKMGFSPKLTEGMIKIAFPIKYKGYIVPMSNFKR